MTERWLRPKAFFFARPIPCLAALAALCLILVYGVAGVGRTGSDSRFDMKYLFVAGHCWWQGKTPYDPQQFRETIAGIPGIVWGRESHYAYPPHSAPLCMGLAMLSLPWAKAAMAFLNVLAALALAVLCALQVKDRFQRARPGEGPPWNRMLWVGAIIVGSPFSCHIVWMGQTALLVAACVVFGWRMATRDRHLWAGIAFAFASIKPQICLLVFVWMALERRWRVVGATIASVGLMAALTIGPTHLAESASGWWASLFTYLAIPAQQLSYRHVFGVRSVFASAGVDSPSLAPVGVLATLLLYRYRHKLGLDRDDWVGLLTALCVLFLYAHDCDIVVAAPLCASYAALLRRGSKLQFFVILLTVLLFVPPRLVRLVDIPLLIRCREAAFFTLAGMLVVLKWRWDGPEGRTRALESA